MPRKRNVDPHIGCFSWPNCDEDPNGCRLLMGDDVESYGYRDSDPVKTKPDNWKKLTDQEILDIWNGQIGLILKARAIEATIREKNKWVGLTDDETDGLIHSATYMDETDLWHLVSLVEERLKEKNT